MLLIKKKKFTPKLHLIKKKKATYKAFSTQILYMGKKKGQSANQIRKTLKLSYSKSVIPSQNVR
jgi:hypothetical protein